MASHLVEKLRKAREFKFSLPSGRVLLLRRPTEADLAVMPAAGALDFVRRFVVGWDFVELDIIAGGGPDSVPFDPDLWISWVDDRSYLWEPIATALLESYKAHNAARSDAEKNSLPGWSGAISLSRQ